MNTKNCLKTFGLIILLILTISCGKDDVESAVLEPQPTEPVTVDPCDDPCANPNQCPGQCENTATGLNREAFIPEGTVTETADGYKVEGKLTIPIDSIGEVIFDNADIDVSFNDDGTLQSLVGNVEVPPLENYFQFAQPLQAEVGFFSGKFLNDNRNYEIVLKDDRHYFVFNIQANLELNIGVNNDPNATKPLSISPGSAGVALITDYTDPMFFFSIGGGIAGGDGNDNGDNNNGDNNNSNDSDGRLLGVSFGGSFGGNIVYEPTNPVDDVVSFGAKTVVGGSASFFKIIEMSGLLYENKGFSIDADLQDPLSSDIGVGYRSGFNGKMDLALEINSFISFGFPIASGSAAVVAEASTNNGVVARAFINGDVDPDLSWYPDFIPIKPDGSLSADGYVNQDGVFDIGVDGSFSVETPNNQQGIEGSMRFSNPAFEIGGKYIKNNQEWSVSAAITKDESEVVVSAPTNFVAGLDVEISQRIDSTLVVAQDALANLEQATADYEFELSLRGLRQVLPTIITTALNTIDEEVAKGIAEGRSRARSELDDRNRVLCGDNIPAIVNGIVDRYRVALVRMRNAVNDTSDNDQTRTELEAALRQLASLNRVNETVTAEISSDWRLTGCIIPLTTNTNVDLNFEVLTNEQVNQLNLAADNVKFIAETSDILISAQAIFDAIPTQEILDRLDQLKQDISTQVKTYSDFAGVGFVKNHNTEAFTFFIEQGGERRNVANFNPFDPDAIIELLVPDL
ncbi:hypothetical protein [Croceitalea rosinachiae]|uniref:Uncharacterized protein n=1 Tax=Croceitalea rosinachiae TaxID=3075596 RepID=A0ABU3AEF9_9FLAO|nr:hypothetical protein [Croceitalea sp. F388]MDT0608574.1 hypothetical protein [Croceitalea sp. F388]